ncbi:MAG: hypothetical protein JRI84_14110 [Deltaproteobacteria bacterium]|nr:hypothetical protein [Deltaproteobacteria bacterium]
MSRIQMEFDFALNCTDVYLGDEFIQRFNSLKEEGRLEIDLGHIDEEQLKAEVLCEEACYFTHGSAYCFTHSRQ